MKKLITILFILAIIFISGCNDMSQTDLTPSPSPTTATTNKISDSDFEKYNDLMAALNSDFSKSENEILQQFTDKYQQSVEELKKFLNEKMEAAVERNLNEKGLKNK